MKIPLRVTSLLIAFLAMISSTVAISNCCEVDANRLGCDDQACQDSICASVLSENCCTVGWTESCVYPTQSSGTHAQAQVRNVMMACSIGEGIKALMGKRKKRRNN